MFRSDDEGATWVNLTGNLPTRHDRRSSELTIVKVKPDGRILDRDGQPLGHILPGICHA